MSTIDSGRHVPRLLLSDGTEPEVSLSRPEIDGDGVLRGTRRPQAR